MPYYRLSYIIKSDDSPEEVEEVGQEVCDNIADPRRGNLHPGEEISFSGLESLNERYHNGLINKHNETKQTRPDT